MKKNVIPSVFCFILTLFIIFLIGFLVYNNRDTYSTNYKALCLSDCVKKDMTDYIGSGDYSYILNNPRFSNFVLKYSNYSAYGAFYLTANYKDDNGDIIRVKGMAFDIDKKDISWPFIGDAAISVEDGKIFVTGDKKIFDSVAGTFSKKLDSALNNMKNVVQIHNEELKPKMRLNGEKSL